MFLSVVCSSVAFGASQFVRAQDAASPTLLEPSVGVTAAPTPRPKKRTTEPSVEIATKAPSDKPVPVAEEMPPAEELATPVPATEKKTHVKRHATPAPQPTAAELPVAGVMSMSAAKDSPNLPNLYIKNRATGSNHGAAL